MRVGMVVCGSLGTTTGGFLYDRRLVRYLRGRGVEVDVIELPWRSTWRGLLDNLDRRVRRRLERPAIDVLLQDELCHPSLCWLNDRLAFEGTVLSIVHHLRSSEPRGSALYGLHRRVERRYLRTVDGVLATSRATRSAVEDLAGVERAAVVPPGTGRFAPSVGPDEVEGRARDAGPLRVVFLGSLVRRKGLDTLLAGLARLPTEAWRCTVVGDESVDVAYAAERRRQADRLGIATRVRFAGRLADPALAEELAAGHVLAVPSRYEGFGIAYLEGMGFGLPPVATTAGGASELVTDGVDGWLVPPDDPGAVARTLRPLLSDRERLARRGRAALSRHAAHPTWEETMTDAYAFIDDVANA